MIGCDFVLVSIEEPIFSVLEAGLEKGKAHKYYKREIVSLNPKKYRYWYRSPGGGLVNSSSLHVGAKFRHGAGDNRGHMEIVQVYSSRDGAPPRVLIRHDETGAKRMISMDDLRELLHAEDHERPGGGKGESWDEKTLRLLADWDQVQKTGSVKQQDRIRKELENHASVLPGKAGMIMDVLNPTAKELPPPALDGSVEAIGEFLSGVLDRSGASHRYDATGVSLAIKGFVGVDAWQAHQKVIGEWGFGSNPFEIEDVSE